MGRRSLRRKTATSWPRRGQRQAEEEEGERGRRRKLPVAEESSEKGYM